MSQLDLVRPPARVVNRLSIDFVLQSVRAITHHLDGDILGGLTVLALLQGKYNQRAARAPEGEANLPRPVSVQSLARSLKTPPETMRRCVLRLVEQEWCMRTPARGVTIADHDAARAKVEPLMADIRGAFRAMLIDFKSIDFDFGLMNQAPEQRTEPDAFRGAAGLEQSCGISVFDSPNPAIDRLILNFGLRIVDGGTVPFGNDYVLTCVFAAIMTANASPFAYDPSDAWRYGTYDTPPPDEARRPASLAEISQMLGLPYETTRRYANTLIARGLLGRDERKFLLVPMDLLQSPRAMVTGMEIVGRFVQMVGELTRIGFDFRSIPSEHVGPREIQRATPKFA